ncbi:uncharacterized protein N7479_010862 [Penicillium vulpinum]|uniref:Uncharacterized protein n=1 Tax=Penicillium vulpinum TaxID=29845 RepID=A0A1V6S0K7_9EURO|nr:uncharacterized protein N7479_010862 [Penicillium vulpinum]KAJ5952449.1 hypothetical protein N7479_010862 [Penicillium vulpinum]OQE07193.1 hypothetical protein PENVUL_c014G08112 [Penicillium vulpinum]
MSSSKRPLEGLERLEHPKEKRVCRPAPLDLKRLPMPTHLANGDNLSPSLVQNNQPSPISAKLFSKVLKINEPPKTTLTQFANGDNLSPRLVQEPGQPSPISQTLFNSLNINERSAATPTQGPFPFSGSQGTTPPVEFNPRLPTSNNASWIVNVNWPLPYTRTVGPVNENGFAVVTQTWYDYSRMTQPPSDSSGSPPSLSFNPRDFPAPRVRTRVQYFGRPDGTTRRKPRFILGSRRNCPECRRRVPGYTSHLIFR